MPNAENIKKWVDALRSGKYKQGKGFLNMDGEYCCLGVACELAIANGVKVEVAKDVHRGDDAILYDGLHGYLPGVVAEWLGTGFSSGFQDGENDVVIGLDAEGYEMSATSANDDADMTFDQIADAIEQ
jgi:hypothetical protein